MRYIVNAYRADGTVVETGSYLTPEAARCAYSVFAKKYLGRGRTVKIERRGEVIEFRRTHP
jgi:hypothetical protein